MGRIEFGESITVVFTDPSVGACSRQLVVRHFGHECLIDMIKKEVLSLDCKNRVAWAEAKLMHILKDYPGSLAKVKFFGPKANREFLLENKCTCFITFDLDDETWDADFYDAQGQYYQRECGYLYDPKGGFLNLKNIPGK